jgi:ATP-binding cassette subfamily A (ABC1) protein 3
VARRYLVGASFTLNERNGTVFTAWFNNDPYHTPGLALALILNTMYGSLLGGNHSIAFANHPLPFTTDTQIDRLLKGNGLGFQLAFNIAFSMSFVASFYILFYIKERVCKSKHLQFASGAKGYIFWTVAFLGDLTTFIVTILALLLTMLTFQEEGFRSSSELGTDSTPSVSILICPTQVEYFCCCSALEWRCCPSCTWLRSCSTFPRPGTPE